MSQTIEVWTDGGCQGNPGPGGWAFVMRGPDGVLERSGYDAQTTNNRMELTAVREALQEISRHDGWKSLSVSLSTDSQYVQKGITEWIHTWQSNGWKTTARKPVKNDDLWRSLVELSAGMTISWLWVLGHAGNELNERCDTLVQQAILKGRG
jgi:ribonuclease HI